MARARLSYGARANIKIVCEENLSIEYTALHSWVVLCHVGTTLAISRVQMCADNVQAIKKLRLYKVIE